MASEPARNRTLDQLTAISALEDFRRLVELFDETALRLQALAQEPAASGDPARQGLEEVQLMMRRSTLLKAAHIFGNHAGTCALTVVSGLGGGSAERTVAYLCQNGRPREWAEATLDPMTWLGVHCTYVYRNKLLAHIPRGRSQGASAVGGDHWRNLRLATMSAPIDDPDGTLAVVEGLCVDYEKATPVAGVPGPTSAWALDHPGYEGDRTQAINGRFYDLLGWLFFVVPPTAPDRNRIDGLVNSYGLDTSFTMRELASHVEAFVEQARAAGLE